MTAVSRVMSAGKETKLSPDEGFPLYDARELTLNGDQARIKLDDQIYALRITRAGKLILTK